MSRFWIYESCIQLVQDGCEKRRTDEEGIEHIYCESCDTTLGVTK